MGYASAPVFELYFDYSSPFAYLGASQAPRIAAAHGVPLVYRPILLGGLFSAIGTPTVPIAAMAEAKQRYIRQDLERWAAHFQVPFRFTPRFPLRTVSALRLTLLSPPERWPALIAEIMRVCWVDGGDPADAGVLRTAAEVAGVSPALVDRLRDDEPRAALRKATEDAVLRGVVGVPTFMVDDLMFWGQDRLAFVERALDGWRPPRG